MNARKQQPETVASRLEEIEAGKPAARRPGGATVLLRSFSTLWSVPKARIGLVLLGVFLLAAILAPLLAPYDAHDNSFGRNEAPSAAHWFGTTGAGEDVLSQVIFGARVSVLVGLVAGAGAMLIAVVVGLAWGYARGFGADVADFVVNLFLVIPGLPLMIVLAAYLRGGGLVMIMLVVIVTGWAWGARVLRAQAQTLRSRDFVTAAQFSGDGTTRIVFREILPNMLSLITGGFFGSATAAILAESGLSFLGLGDPQTVSWGSMLFWAQNSNALLTGQWVLLLAPGLCIALLATSLTLINFGVDGLSNPRLREGKGR